MTKIPFITKVLAGAFITITAATIAIATGSSDNKASGVGGSNELSGTITISGAFALYPLTVKWAEEFRKLHPGVRFDVSAGGAGKGISDALGGLVDLGAVSRDLAPAEIEKGAFPVVVTKDAVVATINADNPNLDAILSRGLTRATFAKIFVDGTITDWKQAGFAISWPIHPYTRSDASGASETWAKYLGSKHEDLKGTGVFGDPGLLQAVQKDASGIGFNNIGYAYDAAIRRPITGVVIVPIDIDGSGSVDSSEQVYATLDRIVDAIAAGTYPSPPARDLSFVSKGAPLRREVIEFLKWVLTTGQAHVGPNGYITLPKERLEEQLKRIVPNV